MIEHCGFSDQQIVRIHSDTYYTRSCAQSVLVRSPSRQIGGPSAAFRSKTSSNSYDGMPACGRLGGRPEMRARLEESARHSRKRACGVQ